MEKSELTYEVNGIFKFTEFKDSDGTHMKTGNLLGGVAVYFPSKRLNKFFFKKNHGVRVIFRDELGHKWKVIVEKNETKRPKE